MKTDLLRWLLLTSSLPLSSCKNSSDFNWSAQAEIKHITVIAIINMSEFDEHLGVSLGLTEQDITPLFNSMLERIERQRTLDLQFYRDGDPWGNQYKVFGKNLGTKSIFRICSAGTDGTFGTKDDVEIEEVFDDGSANQ